LEGLRKSIIEEMSPSRPCITICSGTGCHAYNCEKVTQAFIDEIAEQSLDERVEIKTTGCHGFCERGPIVVIHPQDIFYQRVKPEDVPEIVSETILKQNIVERLLYADPKTGQKIVYRKDVPLSRRQGTMVFNVETWANVPLIIDKGWEWYSKVGTKESKGTKIFSLVGKINNTGLIEVPMGTTLREIIFDIGGGIPGGKRFKAVQTGGPSGGCIPESLIDLPVDFDRRNVRSAEDTLRPWLNLII